MAPLTIDARIALDAMGGDRAPTETVKGAWEAVNRDDRLAVELVGDRASIEQVCADIGASQERLQIRHASQVITGSDSPVEALKSKPDASIAVATRLLKEDQVDGLVAAGNTGAAVAAGTLILKLMRGVRRPGIAVTLPSAGGGHTLLCDAGANITCKPLHLYHYGIMAARLAGRIFGCPEPRVGLMNIGSEEGKGTSLIRETASLFAGSSLNYVGHVEGNDAFGHDVDVIVCEGFVGNVVLKVAEGLFEAVYGNFKDVAAGLVGEGGIESAGVDDLLQGFRKHMDWAEYGGAPLLGVNGLVLISHGRSNARAIRNAILQAAREHRARVLSEMAEDLRAS